MTGFGRSVTVKNLYLYVACAICENTSLSALDCQVWYPFEIVEFGRFITEVLSSAPVDANESGLHGGKSVGGNGDIRSGLCNEGLRMCEGDQSDSLDMPVVKLTCDVHWESGSADLSERMA